MATRHIHCNIGFFLNPDAILKTGVIILLFVPLFLRAQSSPIRMDSVSVVDNNVIIGWTLGEGIEGGYVEIHRRQDNGLYALIQKIPMPQSYFVDTGVDPRQKAYSYYVVAYDAQANLIGSIANNAHQTIHLKHPVADICGRQTELLWDNYKVTRTVGEPVELPSPFQFSFSGVSHNDNEFILSGEMDLSILQQSVEMTDEGNYCFYIRSVNKETGATSTSNIRCLHISFPPHPDYVYIRRVTIEEGKTLVWVASDPLVKDVAYVIQKWDGDHFQSLDTLSSPNGAVVYTDLTSRADQQTETYRVLALDSCLDAALYSQNAASVYLSVEVMSDTHNYLQWNSYEGWSAGVSGFVLQRQVNALVGWEEVATLPGSASQFTDDLSSLQADGLQAEIFYRVVAIENSGNPLGFADSAFSNVVRIEREVEVFIPNAFRPDSHIEENRIFKPVFPFFSPEQYSMQIFNRWGQLIFETNNIWDGWDGSANGAALGAGVYAFVIRYNDSQGNSFEKRGAVLLVR